MGAAHATFPFRDVVALLQHRGLCPFPDVGSVPDLLATGARGCRRSVLAGVGEQAALALGSGLLVVFVVVVVLDISPVEGGIEPSGANLYRPSSEPPRSILKGRRQVSRGYLGRAYRVQFRMGAISVD